MAKFYVLTYRRTQSKMLEFSLLNRFLILSSNLTDFLVYKVAKSTYDFV